LKLWKSYLIPAANVGRPTNILSDSFFYFSSRFSVFVRNNQFSVCFAVNSVFLYTSFLLLINFTHHHFMPLLRFLFLLLLIVYIHLPSYSQSENYPKGVYINLQEVLSKQPSKQNPFKIIALQQKKTYLGLGDEFMIKPDNKRDEKLFRKEAFAVSDGNNLYINCKVIRTQNFYTKILASGQYYVFSDVKVGADPESNSTSFFYLRTLNATTGKIEYLNSEFLFRELSPYKEILQQYLSEDKSKRENPWVLLKYVILLNGKLKS
jgi:hypothetical protein